MKRPEAVAGPPPSNLAAIAQQAAVLLAEHPAEAERLAQTLLKAAPNDPRAALILASARRRRGDLKGARAVLEPLARAHPRAVMTQYELGLVRAALGETAAAIAALRIVTSLNPAMAEAWRALGDQLFLQGEIEGANKAFSEHARASVRDPRLKEAADALYGDRLAVAERRLREHLLADPNHVEALRLLAEAYGRLSRHADAETLLGHALTLEPGHDGARFAYANALFHQQKAAEALPHVERLLAAEPKNPAYRNLLAACLGLIGEYERANGLYEGLLAEYGRQPRIWLNYGHSLRTVGRREDAVAAYKRCIALAPGLGDAYWSLANLKVASFTADEVSAMAAQLQRPDLAVEDRLHLHYALGKALEDRGDPEGSFAHYAQGARIRRAEVVYDPDETTRQTDASRAFFTRALFDARAGMGSDSEDPIFILGLPRSGSTLVEQILASHSAVEGTMELPDIGLIAKSLGWPGEDGRYPALLADLDPAKLKALGELYIERTRIHRKLGRRLFIDKMPNNFQHLGLIQLILPRAKIVDARRHPLGVGFSAFKQHFAQGQSFSYDLADLGRYYRDYAALMAHFDAVLPGRVHRVIYEDLVQDTEAQVRALLDYCALDFEPACLKFYENDRAVMTVSSEQVRRPIFREGLEQWRRYEPWLGPLKQALGPALDHWRGEPPRTEP
jgi:tetratricopeptide (TPR) repeat protein